MSTPADLAASAARAARSRARRAGAALGGIGVDADETPDVDHFRAEHEARYGDPVAAEQIDPEEASLEDLTVADLKELLAARDLPVSGTKAELVERLRADDEAKSGEED